MADLTRRRLLHRAGTAAGSVTLAALAGCSSDGSNGSDGNDGTGADGGSGGDGQTGSSALSYGTWLVPPNEFGEQERYLFQSRQPSALLALEAALGDVDLSQYRGTLAPGIEWRDVEHFHRVPGGTVVTGDLSVGEWQSSLAEQGYSESETYREFALYTNQDGGVFGFGDGTVLVNQSRDGAVRMAKTVIDTHRGERRRASVVNDDVGALVEALGEGTVVAGTTTPNQQREFLPGSVAAGQRFSLDESESEYSVVVVYESESAVEVQPVVDRVGSSVLFEGPDSLSTQQQGRVAVITGTLPTGEVATLSPSLGDSGDTADVPQVNFAFEFDADAGTLTVTHQSGDFVAQSALYVRGSGFADREGVDMTGPGQWQGSTSGEQNGEPAIVAGDRVTIGVTSGYEIRLVWESESGDTSATLAQQSGPDA